MKKLLIISLLLSIATLAGCSSASTNASSQSTGTQSFLPVNVLWNNQPIKPIQTLANVHSILFQSALVVAGAPDQGLVVSSPAQRPDPRYPDGLYLVNTSSGSVTQLLRLNAQNHEQINHASADDQWLVYELGTDTDTQSTWSIFAYNWATRKTFKIYSVPQGHVAYAEPSGLSVDDNHCIWSDYTQAEQDQTAGTSEIHDYDLTTHQDSILLTIANRTPSVFARQSGQQAGIIYASSVGDGIVTYWLFNGSDPMDTSPSGDIYAINLATKTTAHLVHLYHCDNMMCSYGNEVVMETDYNVKPNGPDNPAPYPIYLFKPDSQCLYQISGKDADYPTQNQRFVAWTGPAYGEPQIYDLKTDTYYTSPGILTSIEGPFMTSVNPVSGILYWAKLPN
jgi:hypothetical protein